jgi:ABC-type glycerol-3-phosphate transport system permease component
MGYRHQRFIKSFIAYILALVGLFITLFPIFWVFTISIKTQREAFALPPVWVFKPIWSNYIRIWGAAGFADAFRNSTIIVILGLLITLTLAIPAAYAMVRLPFRGKGVFSIWLLLAYMLPEFLFIIPMYVIWQRMDLYDTYLGLVIAYQVVLLPYTIWLLKGFFEDIPVELEDAARIDGCTRLQTLQMIYLPLAAPGISATAILTGIWIWNEVAFALALTFSDAKTVTIAAAGFRGYASIDWGAMTAASMVSIVPMLIFTFFAQKYIVQGLTLGSFK